MANDLWSLFKRALSDAWTSKSEIDRAIQLPGRGAIEIKSADRPETLVGVALDGVVFDEAGIIKPEVWRESVRPTLTDRGGWAMFLGTPKGHNWFETLHRNATQADGWGAWQLPTRLNSRIPAEELAEARRDMGQAKYAQEFEAQFTSVEGAEFASEWFGPEIWVDAAPLPVELSAVAVDPSKGRDLGDFSGIVWLGLRDDLLYVDAEVERLAVPDLARRAVAMASKYRPDVFVVEGNAWQDVGLLPLFSAEISRVGQLLAVPQAIDNLVNKAARIQRLSPYLEQRRVRFVDSPGTRRLVEQLQEFPVGSHDDGPDALEMAIRAAQLHQAGRPVGPARVIA